jgi:hypothetical protein
MLFDNPTQIDPPHETPATALEFLHAHYAEVRKRLGKANGSGTVPRRRVRGPEDLHATRYEEPIGPKPIIYSAIVVRDLNNPLREIANRRGLKLEYVLAKGRSEPEVACRAVMAHYLRGRGMSLPRIGQMLNRDHTSIMHLISTRNENGERIR